MSSHSLLVLIGCAAAASVQQVASLEVEELGLVLEVGGSAVAPGSLGLFARLAPGTHAASCARLARL